MAVIVFLAVGTQLSDLIDRPLAWTVRVLPTGRMLEHSLLFAVPVCVALYLYFRRHNRLRVERTVAFAVGTLSHVVNALPPSLCGDPVYIRHLLWPGLSRSGYDTASRSIVGHFTAIDLTEFGAFQLGLAVVAVIVWVLDE
jgi:hypothetical protein